MIRQRILKERNILLTYSNSNRTLKVSCVSTVKNIRDRNDNREQKPSMHMLKVKQLSINVYLQGKNRIGNRTRKCTFDLLVDVLIIVNKRVTFKGFTCQISKRNLFSPCLCNAVRIHAFLKKNR